MAASSPSQFAADLATLEPAAFRAFVADLFSARGHDIVATGEGWLRTRDPFGEERTVAVLGRADVGGATAGGSRGLAQRDAGGAAPAIDWSDVDAVAVAVPRADAGDAGPPDARVLASEDLREFVRYAVDPAAADALCREYFGQPATRERSRSRTADAPATGDSTARSDPLPEPGRASGSRADDDQGRERPVAARLAGRSGARRRVGKSAGTVAAAAMAALLLAAAAGLPLAAPIDAAVGMVDGPADDRVAGTAGPGQEDPGGSAGATTLATPPTTEPDGGTGGAATEGVLGGEGLPPGVGEDGIENASVLASSHARSLGGLSYRLTITYVESHNWSYAATARESTAVERPPVYRSTVDRDPSLRTDPWPVATHTTYADGRQVYVRRGTDTGSRYATMPAGSGPNGRGRIAVRTARSIERYLSGEYTAITGRFDRPGRRLHRVRVDGASWPGVEAYTATAVVGRSGIVYQLHAAYEVPAENVSVVVSMRIEDVANASVERPPWYGDAVNATRGGR